jgi:signal transduction histidine kinase
MTTTTDLDAWDRREGRAYRAIPYFMLVASTGFAVGLMDDDRRVTVALAAVTLAWLVLTQTRGPRPVHYAGLLALIGVLVLHNPLFGFFAISGYLAADAWPGRWMYAGVAWTAFWMGTSQVGGLPLPESTPVYAWLAVVAVNITVGSALMAYGAAIDGRNKQLKAALAENAKLAREAGIQEERRRMAGEIHDTLAQGLTGVVAQLEALEHAHGRGGDWRRHLDTAARLARESLAEARRSVRAVAPQALEGARLPDAIADVARHWSAIHGVEAEVVTTGTARPMRADVEVTLLRTAQEALANVGRHAQAERVGLTLSYMEDVVTLDVRDDGVGFTPNGNHGYGLRAMLQRVEGVDGELVIESGPGAGTAVCATVPAREAT